MSQFAQENPCVPIKVDAFVLNPAVADDPDIRIAPITQPNYTFLRLSNSVIQNDILDPVDLHYATPSTNNSRVTDLGSGNVLQNRMGVYVSWTLPRVYRMGIAGTQASNTEAGRDQRGFSKISGTPDYSAADFRPVPTRWLVVRHLDLTTAVPQITDAKVAAAVQCRAWVITSDEFRSLEQLDDTVDLQVDVSPFIAGSTTKTDTQTLMKQAEVFIGRKWDASDWSEDQVKETVPITVLNSSNHLFSDFQLHNSSVFSMLDDFSYTDETGKRAAFTSATASYVVIGWHANAGDDPFYMQPPSQKNQPDTGDVAPETQGGRINSLNMVMSGDTSDRQVSSFLQETRSARMVCHGSIYQAEWDATKAPPSTAKKASQNLATNQPIAVGGTAIDTVLAHAHTHQNDPSGADATSKVEADIWALRALLRAQDAGPDGAQEAQDELNAHNYDRDDGGALWHLSGASGDQKIVPSDDIKKQLRLLNDTQYVLDNLYRTRTQVQWELFSMWWKYVSDENPDAAITASAMKTTALRLQTLQNGSAGSPYSIPYYENQVVQTRNTISKMSDGSITTIKGAVDPFSQRKDPTFLIAGLQSGFPEDFTEQLKIRVASQVIPGDPSKSLTWNALATVIASVVPKLPGGADQGNIQDVTRALLSEFFVLSGSQDTPQPPATAVYPLYHDHGPSTDPTPDPESPMRDQWGGQQPWLPLFVEWQAEYFHIPWSEWEMASHSDGGPNHTWEYSLKATGFDPLWKQNITDTRTLSGRVLILPQPSSSLYNAVSRLFQTRLADVQAAIPDEKERDGLLARIRKLALLSSPLAGLTSHLITLVQGTHIKPAQRPPGSVVATMDAAMDTLKDLIPLGVPADVLGLIGTQTANTPYGNLARVTRIGRNPIFKPVTHGQFKFTQLNVIDKFGQAICALDPDPVPPGQEPTFPPILARGYEPQEWTDQQQPGAKSLPNVVEQDKKDPQTCNFVQVCTCLGRRWSGGRGHKGPFFD
ncbi:hypothetical protein BKA56DRAFT_606799 [Ilyonectria sp. MPI-CAGE-AT-0026]|nr:hypothetical protein BKA56DRAFT_606799 [Ilyonectria sp. MPI-CAGE-AT-0026]